MKRAFLAAMVAMGFVLASPATAGAWMTYCDYDPLVLIVTPAGHVVPVYDSVWTSSLLDLAVPLTSVQTARTYVNGAPATAVTTTIDVPTGLLLRYQTYDEVTSGLLGSGFVYAHAYGYSGTPTVLKFTLPTP